MLTNHIYRNLRIQNEDGTDLQATNDRLNALLELMETNLQALSRRVDNRSIAEESYVFVRLNRRSSLVIYINPEYSNNPYLYRYDTGNKKLSCEIAYEDLLRLEDPSVEDYFIKRCGNIMRLDMGGYLVQDEVAEMRLLSADYDEEHEMT
jgi:hypothetical protein